MEFTSTGTGVFNAQGYLRFRIIQACNPPDTILLIALLFRLVGVKFVFDQHDPFPELFEIKFGRNNLLYRLVRLAEWLTFRTADAVMRDCERLSRPERFSGQAAQGRPETGTQTSGPYIGVMGSQDGPGLLIESIDYLVHEKNAGIRSSF